MVIKRAKSKDFLTISEACELFNIHPNTLRNWDKSGRLKAIRIGNRQDRRYRKKDLTAFFYGKEKEKKSGNRSKTLNKVSSINFQDVKPLGSALPILREK